MTDLNGQRGTQVERTALSWNPVAIAVVANGALLTRAGFLHDIAVLEVLGLTVACAGFALWLLPLVRYSKIAGQPVPHLFPGTAGALGPRATFVFLLTLVDLIVAVVAR